MEDLAKLTASARLIEISCGSFRVKPLRIRDHAEFQEDAKSVMDEVILQLSDPQKKETLVKWIERQVLTNDGKTLKFSDLVESDANVVDLKTLILAIIEDSGFH